MMDFNNIRIQVIQRLDQEIASFRSEYFALSDSEKEQLRRRLEDCYGLAPGTDGRVAQRIFILSEEDGTVRSIFLNPSVFLEAIAAWKNDEYFSPAPGAIFPQNTVIQDESNS